MLNGYFLGFATPERTWVAYALFATGGVFGAGFLFSSFNMILKLVPKNAKTTAISLNLAASSLAGAVSPIIGGIAIEWAVIHYDFLEVFHMFSAFHHTVILMTVFILLTVQEPKSSSLWQASGAMRPLRQIGSIIGISFVMNYSFFKKRNQDNNPKDN